MKKTFILLMLLSSLVTKSEETVITLQSSTISAIEVASIKEIEYGILKEKPYLNNLLNEKYNFEVFYDEKKKINKIIFEKLDSIFSFSYFSFENNKIFEKHEKNSEKSILTVFYENQNKKKIEKDLKDSKTIEEYNENGTLLRVEEESKDSKKYKQYYENSNIKEMGQYIFVNNKWEKIGNWQENYENGKAKNIYTFKGLEYYETNYSNNLDNIKNYEGKNIFLQDKWYKDGWWTFYENGIISYRANFLKGKGKFYNYYDEDLSNISIETSVIFNGINWVWEGEKVFYSNSGKVLERQIKENGSLVITGYYENQEGAIRYKGERDYNNNSDKIGTWVYYNENGKIDEVIEYSGNLAKIKEYFDFDNNKLKFVGNITKKQEYYSWIGEQNYFDIHSNKTAEIVFQENGVGDIKLFFDNGNVYQEGFVYSDFIQNSTYYIGQLKEFDKTGKLKVIYNYEKGILDGETLYFDNNEKLRVKKLYKNGEFIKIEDVK